MSTVGKPVTIRVDHREPASFIRRLGAIEGVTLRVEQMEVGDYEIAPGVCVERKGIDDFGQSIADRRLFRQVKEARDANIELIFLLDGDPFSGQRDIHENGIVGALSYLVAVEGLAIVQTPSALAPRMVADLARHRQLGLGYEIKMREARPKDPRAAQLYLLQGLPGIGPAKAKALLGHFGTARGVMTASAREIASVEGFGPKSASAVCELLDRRTSNGACKALA